MTRTDEVTRAPVALTIVFVIVVVEAVAEIAFVTRGTTTTAAAKAALIVVLALKVWFAHLTRKLSPGGVLGLLMVELVGLLAVLAAPWDAWFRIGLGLSIVAVFALVVSSLHAFPTPEIR